MPKFFATPVRRWPSGLAPLGPRPSGRPRARRLGLLDALDQAIPALKHHYEVWAVDLPGLGDSAMPPHPHTPESSGKALALRHQVAHSARAPPRTSWLSRSARTSHTFAFWSCQDWVADFTITGCAALGLPQGPGIDFPRSGRHERGGAHRRASPPARNPDVQGERPHRPARRPSAGRQYSPGALSLAPVRAHRRDPP